MHDAVKSFIASARTRLSVLEIGSKNINGSIREFFPGWHFTGIDMSPGDGVDIVADGATWDGNGQKWRVVVCCEVLEHAPDWKGIVSNAYLLTEFGGMFIGTAAGPNRPAHKCSGAPMPNPPDEPYQNIDPNELRSTLISAGFKGVTVDALAEDVRWIAVK